MFANQTNCCWSICECCCAVPCEILIRLIWSYVHGSDSPLIWTWSLFWFVIFYRIPLLNWFAFGLARSLNREIQSCIVMFETRMMILFTVFSIELLIPMRSKWSNIFCLLFFQYMMWFLLKAEYIQHKLSNFKTVKTVMN